MALIHEVLPKVAAEIGCVEKAKKHQQGYQFRGIDDALAACAPAFRKYGVLAVPDVLKHELVERLEESVKGPPKCVTRATLLMRVTFLAGDGSNVSAVTAGEAWDHSGDRATNKAMASAYKYALFLGLTLPVDAEFLDDADTNPPPAESVRETNGTPTAQRVVETDYDKARRAIADLREHARLTEAGAKIETSAKYSAEQKKLLHEAIAARLLELAQECPA